MKAMRRIWLMVAVVGLGAVAAYAAPSPWEQPAFALANQVAAILGPGQAHLVVRNLSSIATGDIPAIRRLLTQDLKARGVTLAGEDCPNTLTVTLSESARERLWVAEVAEGKQTQVAIVDAGAIQPPQLPVAGGLTLLSQQILAARDQLLAVLETPSGLVVLEPEQIDLYAHAAGGWQEQQHTPIEQRLQLERDRRGILVMDADGQGFDAWLPGIKCSLAASAAAGDWAPQCRESDDPWPIVASPFTQQPAAPTAAAVGATASLSAFYNAARDYFTGVVTPGVGVDLPPFYSAALIPRSSGSTALLIGGIDGKVQLVESNALHPVAGARDWSSDFAVLHSGCGAGVEVIVSGSGAAASDSLRAYEIPAFEAVPASAPLSVNGTVTALWTAPDGKSVFAVVRNPSDQYEVDRVTALCN